MGRIIEGVWDCAYCGAKKVRGSLRDCPQCGHPRDNNVTFYIDNPKNYVYDEEEAARARIGPDWVCPACECLNPADKKLVSVVERLVIIQQKIIFEIKKRGIPKSLKNFERKAKKSKKI